MISCRIVLGYIVVLFAAYLPVQAQNFQSPTTDGSDSLGRTSPRGTVIGFLTAAHKGEWAVATQYINSTKGEDPAELATQLSVVLDQGLPATLGQISDKPEGDLKDNLPPTRELIGTIATNGGPLNVFLDRVRRGTQSIWLFSPDTLKEVPAVYDEFNSAWIAEYVPHLLLRRGWLGVPLWQWLVLIVGVALAMLIAAVTRKIAVPLFRTLLRSVAQDQDEFLLDRLIGPLRGLAALLVLAATISSLRLPLFARELWYFAGGSFGIILTGWLVVRVIHVSGRIFARSLQRRQGADVTAVIRLGERIFTGLTFTVVVVQLLQLAHLVKDVSTLVAGLGVGGIAVAFAAQKTLENLFGGVSIIFDRTIRVGDYCRIGDQKGSVEDIGLRSTSLRTDANTVLTVPNGKLSAMDVENFGMRRKIFFHHVIGIRCETSARQVRALLDALRQLLAADTRIEPNAMVRFVRFGQSSLDIEIAAYILTTDGTQFMAMQEDLLLRIMDAIEASGTATAFPSQTLYLGKDHPPATTPRD